MKTYSYLANKQFKFNKKRNFSIVLGIVLSIILFTTVGYIQSFAREIDIVNAKEERGNYEAIFKNISKEDLYKLKNNVLIRSVGIYKKEAEDKVKIGNLDKTIEVYALDSESIHNLFKPLIKISKGRYPVSENEIILNQSVNLELNKYIDDKITIGDKSYVIVGFCDNEKYYNPYVINGITYLEKELFDGDINVAIISKDIKNKLVEIKNIANIMGISMEEVNEERGIIFNKRLFDSYGVSVDKNTHYIDEYKIRNLSLYGITFILSTILTYSSINVSIKERIQHFSILRCIGATPSKIRILLIKESLLLIVFSLIPGIILGQIVCFLISGVIFNKIIGINTYGILYKVYWNVILAVIILSLLNIIISIIIPIINIEHISPIQGAKTGGKVKSNIKRGKYKIIKKLFGYNAELGYKNIRRDNKSFVITTAVLSILLVIFSTFTGYYNFMISKYDYEDNRSKDISMIVYNNLIEDDEKINLLDTLNKYKSDALNLNVIQEINLNINCSIKALFKGVNLNKYIKTINTENNYGESIIYDNEENHVYSNHVLLLIYDDESINKILPYIDSNINYKNNINLEDFKENGVIIAYRNILKNGLIPKKEKVFNLNQGENFEMYIDNSNRNNGIYKQDFDYKNNIQKFINIEFLGNINSDDLPAENTSVFSNYTTLIASKDFYENNKEILLNSTYRIEIQMNLKKTLDREFSKNIIENYANKIGAVYSDNKFELEYNRKNFLAFSYLIYTTLFLIIIIGGIVILNNKNISILLRKKEFGILISMGINKKRLKNILLFEGIIQWCISSTIGILSSYIILKVVYSMLYYTGQGENFEMPIFSILLGAFILFIIILLGSYLPVTKFNEMELTELIRNEE